ncbi:MAG: response regulator transcription factor [Oceanococcaceae bacterium]
MKVLVVDDDSDLRGGVQTLLEQHGFTSEAAPTAEWADSLTRTHNFTAIVLDLGLPDGDGLQLLRQWRQRGLQTPVIVVSARGAPDDRADGILAGADDYLAKPYHARELLARLQRVVHGSRDHATALPFGARGQFAFDVSAGQLHGPNGPLPLSPTLRQVLTTLIAARQRSVSKDALRDQAALVVDDPTDNAVEQWIRRLRQQLGADTIITEPGRGYRLRWPDATASSPTVP